MILHADPAASPYFFGWGGKSSAVAVDPRLLASLAFLALLRVWRSRVRERRELIKLTGSELRDFRVNRTDAIAEWCKPFWRA